MLGSTADAEDAVQEAWLRLSRPGATAIDNLGGWLTTVVARECLHTLRSRRTRREVLVDLAWTPPAPGVTVAKDDPDPAHQAAIADAVGVALLLVLESLKPAERVAFVLHDMFGVPFDEIAPLVERTSGATRQLASRARRRVREKACAVPDGDRAEQWRIVDAFYAAVDAGDLSALLAVLDPDAVLRAEYGAGRKPRTYSGAQTIARLTAAARGAEVYPVMVNDLPGVVACRGGRPVSLMSFTIASGRITAINGIRDPDRVEYLVRVAIERRLEDGG
jgi:RNA polymerase sigma-70 factor (ECF subfamily)